MRIRSITIGAGLTFPSRAVQFANVKPSIEVTADLNENDDENSVRRLLQQWCREAIEEAIKPLEGLLHVG